jgi:hypothetical protein
LDHGTDIANVIDDMPINRATNAHGQGYSDLNFIIPQVLEGLDYTKGTYAASIGDFGDVASEHMRIADVIPNQVAASAGTLGDDELFVGGAHPLESSARVMAGLDLSKVDGPFDPPNNFRKYAGIVRFSQGTRTNGGDLTSMYFKGDGSLITDQPVRAVTERLIGRYGTLDPSDGNSSERLSVSGHYAWTQDSWSAAMSAYDVHSRMTLWNDFTHFLEDPVNGDQEQQDETRDMAGGQGSLTLNANLGMVQSETTVGVQGRYDDIYVDRRHTRDRQVLDYCELLNPDGVTAVQVDVGRPECTADRVHLGDVGIYVENTAHWTAWLRTVIGAREELYGGDDQSLIPGTVHAATPFRQGASLFQPKANLIFGPWAHTEFYVSAGRGFHSDDMRGVSGTVPLEDLGGVRTAHLQAAAFNIRLNSGIVYDQDQGEDQPGPPSDRYGVEISGEYRPTPWLELNTDLSFDHARFVTTSAADLLNNFGDDGAFIPLAPAFIGSFGAIVDNLGPWFGGLQVRSLGPYALVSDNSERDNGYTETNIAVGYKVSPSARAQIDVFNLFNVKANAAAFDYTSDIHDGNGPVADHQVHPLEPISVRISVTKYF